MTLPVKKIVILETSDVHGQVVPHSYADGTDVSMGLARAATLIQAQYKQYPGKVMYVDNGDILQGSPLTTWFYNHWLATSHLDSCHTHFEHQSSAQQSSEVMPLHPVLQILHALQCSAVIVGNHELNYGIPFLSEMIRNCPFPWLSANLLDVQTAKPKFGPPYLVTELDGIRVGLIGVTTEYITHWELPESLANLNVVNPLDTVQFWVDHLRNELAVEVVVVAYHGGFERDPDTGAPSEALTGENRAYELCQSIKGMDVLLTGHQHRSLARTVNGVAVIQPGCNAQYVGKVTVELAKRDGMWNVTRLHPELLATGAVKPNQQVLQLIHPYEQATQKWLDEPLGTCEGDFIIQDALSARLREHPYVAFLHRVQMEVSGATISAVAIFNNASGGFPKHITRRSILLNYPFVNSLVVVRVTGAAIHAALEKSATYFVAHSDQQIEVNPVFLWPKEQHYNYDMWAGVDYTLDLSRAPGQRVIRLWYQGVPLQSTAFYEVVLSNYRASGGGDYEMFRGAPVVRYYTESMQDLMTNYIYSKKVIQEELFHNWDVTYGKHII